MEKTVCELVISIKIYSFFNETKEYVYKRAPLNQLDEFTYITLDEETFFENHKKEIYRKVSSEFEREHFSAITAIELGENGIYINKEGKRIRPLFKTIDYHETKYDVKDILLSRLFNLNLIVLFACEQYRKTIEDYDSFLEGFPYDFLERIQLGAYTKEDILLFWEGIKLSNRFYSLLRFLLGNYSHCESDEIMEEFMKEVPAKEVQRKTSTSSKEYTYWLPYKDD